MQKVILHKVLGGENVRTDSVEGTCNELPSLNKSFSIIAKPLIEGSIARIVSTSEVQEIIPDETGMIIKTLNSTYKVEVVT